MHPRFHSKSEFLSNAKCPRHTCLAAPFLRKASPLRTAIGLSLTIEWQVAREFCLWCITRSVGSRPGNNAGEESSGEVQKYERCQLPKSWRDAKNPDRRPVRLPGIEPAKRVE
jgi:hypothetical protein